MMTNPTGRITQGQFSFLPDLSDDEIRQQIEYGLSKGYAWTYKVKVDGLKRAGGAVAKPLTAAIPQEEQTPEPF